MRLGFTVDGAACEIVADPDRRLIDILREDLGVTAAKNGCGIGRCGACLVIVDGRPVNACLVPAARLDGVAVVTALGLGAAADRVRAALAAAGGVQCGYCASGVVTLLTALLDENPRPGPEAVLPLIAGQICRCTGYGGLRRAVDALFGAEATARR